MDLAQQLINLGVNTKQLVYDLQLFDKTGPMLAHVIEALSRRQKELESLLESMEGEKVRRGGWGWVWILCATVLAILLASSHGLLGDAAKTWLDGLL